MPPSIALPSIGLATGAATLAAGSAATSVVGGVVGAVGAEEQASATEKASNYQAQVAQNNEQIAKTQAQQTEAAGETAVEQQGLKTKAEVGAIEAGQAASNIDVNQGSAVDVRSSAEALGQLDALTIRSNAERQAYGYETAATSYQGQAGLEQMEASQAPVAGAISAGSSILGGATAAGNQYARYLQSSGSPSGGNNPPALFP